MISTYTSIYSNKNIIDHIKTDIFYLYLNLYKN